MRATICDICGCMIPGTDSRYALVRKGLYTSERLDICNSCIKRIKNEVQESKEERNEFHDSE